MSETTDGAFHARQKMASILVTAEQLYRQAKLSLDLLRSVPADLRDASHAARVEQASGVLDKMRDGLHDLRSIVKSIGNEHSPTALDDFHAQMASASERMRAQFRDFGAVA